MDTQLLIKAFRQPITLTNLSTTLTKRLIMLAYAELILDKVSFDQLLFEKELQKALKSMPDTNSREQLRKLCYEKFGKTHSQVLAKYFAR